MTKTVRQMERDGLVTRTVHPVIPPRVEYELTDPGRSLEGDCARLWGSSKSGASRVLLRSVILPEVGFMGIAFRCRPFARDRKSLVGLAVWIAAASGASLMGQSEPKVVDGGVPTLHAYANLIQIPTLVLWPDREPVKKPIDAGKFSISIDSGAWFRATHVRQEGDDPISLSILLDLSGDTAKLMSKISTDLSSLAPLSLHPIDRVSIYALSCGRITSIREVAADNERLKKAVDLVMEPWKQRKNDKHAKNCEQGVGLWDSVAVVALKMMDLPGRRVILAVTDGLDKESKHPWNEVTEFVQDTGVAVFGLSYSVESAIGDVIVPNRRGGGGTYRQTGSASPQVAPQFTSLCEMSGGIVTRMNERGSPQESLQKIVQTVRQRYIVEFPRPSNSTAGKHNMQVKVGKDDYVVLTAGVSVPIPDPALMSDPTTVPSDPSRSPEQGPRKPLPKPQ